MTSGTPQDDAVAAPVETAGLSAGNVRAMRSLAMAGGSWSLDGALLVLLWQAGGVRVDAPLIMAVGLTTFLALFYTLYRTGWNARFRDRFLAVPQLVLATGIALACAWRAPEVGVLMILSIFIVFTFGALRLRPRQLVVAWLVTSVAIGLLAISPRGMPSMPLATPTQVALSLGWIVLSLGRCGFLGMYGASLRKRLSERNVQLDEARARLQVLATRDSLTGAVNRRVVTQVVEDAVAVGLPVAVVLADLDHFKQVNDRYGHPVGDLVLQRFVEIAGRGLRAGDVLGRFGGEEFLLALQGIAEPATALAVAERIRQAVATHDWNGVHPGLAVTTSFGVALAQPGESMTALVKRADHALYAAKHAGRNRSELG